MPAVDLFMQRRRFVFVEQNSSREVHSVFGSVIDQSNVQPVTVCIDSLSAVDLTDQDFLFLVLPQPGSWISHIQRIKSKLTRLPIAAIVQDISPSDIGFLSEANIRDIIVLPIAPEGLKERLNGILTNSELSGIVKLEEELFLKFGMDMIAGEAECFVPVVRQIPVAGCSDAPVLIYGETGTGKELFARAIHYLGHRSSKPFIPVNCGAIPESLFENELFGHRRGAYTGASADELGLISEAEGGTLFLDEINTLSNSSQVKLLRFLEDKTYRALGSSKYIQSNLRIISATNVDMDAAVKTKEFRQDLLYRINVLSIQIPSLRDRSGDVPILARHFLKKHEKISRRGPMFFSEEALRKLSKFSWPGNVRELENVVEKLMVMSNSNIIRPDEIQLPGKETSVEGRSFREERERVIRDFEVGYLRKILDENQWNVTRAAQQAHVDRRSFQRLLRKYDLAGAGIT